tara:strand:- start:14 stop:1531 length:1518 start_codon:yes stop_codon:yes gene_type:complete
MPVPLFNSIASWFLKKRIHQMELFIKYPIEVQKELLDTLIKNARETEIGKLYDFNSIKNYKSFKNRVPIVDYDKIEKLINRSRKGEQNIFWPSQIKWFAKSSGTTNSKSKFIPVSNESLEDCHYKAGKDMLSIYFNNNEDSQLLSGKSLRLGGSRELYNDNNTYFGDLSAIIIDNLPFWAELSSTPSHKVSLMSEWESKMKAIIKEAIPENVTSLAGVPSWMLVLLNNLIKKTNKNNILEIWPNLEVYFHGGINFNPYKSEYQKLFPDKNFKYYEIYNASEGFFGIQDQNNSDELLLMLDYGIFYEFIPLNSKNEYDEENIVSLEEIELYINYAIVISTNAGLWRYKIGDTIEFTCKNPFRIKVTGRIKHHINAFGEELIIDNAENALSKVLNKTNCEIADYTVAPIFMENKNEGAHEWVIEFKKNPKNIQEFTFLLDKELKKQNSDYEAKRYKNLTLNLPKINIAKKGLFYNWLKKNNKLGGQHKIPRLSNDRNFIEELKKMNN